MFVKNSKEIYPRNSLKTLKNMVKTFMAGYYGLRGMRSLLSSNHIQFIYLHHFFKNEEQQFIKLLSELRKHYRIIGYSEAVNKVFMNKIDEAYLAISIDDGFKCSLNIAETLKSLEIKACFFIFSSMIGETDFQIIKEFNARRLLRPPIEFLSWKEVGEILKMGHEIGGHTVTHPILSNCSLQQATDEINQSFNDLLKRIGPPDHFAWPFGRFSDITGDIIDIIYRAGYKSCASGIRGNHIPAVSEKKKIPYIFRDYIQADWPIAHSLYYFERNFLKKNK